VFGLRAGYVFDPARDTDWWRDCRTVTDVPSPRLNGAYVMVTLGGGRRGHLDMKKWKPFEENDARENAPDTTDKK
jgi:hypothetical protein